MNDQPDHSQAQRLMDNGQFALALAMLKGVEGATPAVEYRKGFCLAALGRTTEARAVVQHLKELGHVAMAQRLAAKIAEEDPFSLEPSRTSASPPIKGDGGGRWYRYGLVIALAGLCVLVGALLGVEFLAHARGTRPPTRPVSTLPLERNVSAAPTGAQAPMSPPSQMADGPTNLTGVWQSVDYVDQVADFKPGAKNWSGDLFLKELRCTANGLTSLSWRWGDGWITHSDGRTQAQYYVKMAGDTPYLFLPWLSGDVTERGQEPDYYVLKKASYAQRTTAQAQVPAQYAAKHTLKPEMVAERAQAEGPTPVRRGPPQRKPLVWTDGSPDLTGVWRGVDFVQEISDFRPGTKSWEGALTITSLRCYSNGKTSRQDYRWGNGWLVRVDGRAQALYHVGVVNGNAYLFFPWLSGDVFLRGQRPHYYVLKRVGN